MKPTLQIIILGCSKNRVDVEHLLPCIEEVYDILPEGADPLGEGDGRVDTVLLDTCGFIGDAKEESITAILAQAQRKKEGLVGRIVVMGCLSQRYASELPSLIPEVDAWFGARELVPVINYLGGSAPEGELPTRRTRTQGRGSYAYMKISEGCDRRCSYCAIPLIRGPHRSVPVQTLVKEARELASRGVRELILIAQDTTFYGLDLYRRRALGTLLQALCEVPGIEWIRIHYSYPQDFPEDVLDIMASSPKICRYMDIPLQHVSDRVLANMHRGVDGKWTRELIGKMRERVPGIVLRTTMIVGHPGEGPSEFKELLSFVEEARFERLGAFTYSEEEGTFGQKNFKDSIRPSTKERRLSALMREQSGISFAYNLSRVGKTISVLVDDILPSDGILVCRSEFESPEVDGEVLVNYDPLKSGGLSLEEMPGHFLEVEVSEADEYDLRARMIGMLDAPRREL